MIIAMTFSRYPIDIGTKKKNKKHDALVSSICDPKRMNITSYKNLHHSKIFLKKKQYFYFDHTRKKNAFD